MSTSTSSSTSTRFCDASCSGHLITSMATSFPSSRAEFSDAIAGKLTFEHLKECLLQLRHAQMDVEGSRFKLPNGFCVGALATVHRIALGIEIGGVSSLSLESRLVMLFIARQLRTYTLECPNLVDEEYARPLDGAESSYLTYASFDHGLNNLCRISGRRDFSRYLSLEQRRAITLVEGSNSTTISETMARSIVNTMHVATIVQECMSVPELATFPPGILPIVGAYVPDSIEDLAPQEQVLQHA